MKTATHYICDECNKEILKETEGFVVHGNIYTANPIEVSGIIGNNFTEQLSVADDVKKSVFCKACFFKILIPPPVSRNTIEDI
jgi:hypothetical protein